MSIAPIWYDFASEMENLRKFMLSDDFGLGLFPRHIFQMNSMLPISFFHPQFMQQPFQQLQQFSGLRDEKENMIIDRDRFQVTFDTKEFKPHELSVKTFNNFVVVEGKHEERKDDCNMTQRHFLRTYLLPTGYNADEVVSTISTDGILSIKAPPLPQSAIDCKERTVQIKETGTNYIDLKDKSVE